MTDEKDLYASGEPGLSYDPLEIDEGWEPPYRNKNACLEQKLAKEIGEMSDKAVEVAVKKYFVKNPCNEIEIGIMDFDALQKELEVAQSLHKVAVRERDYERTLCDRYKKEIIRLKSLCRRAAEEIRDLDDHIIALVGSYDGAGEQIGYDGDPLACAGMSSINLLNRLDGRTKGGYVENYEDLHLEMKVLDGHYQFDNSKWYNCAHHDAGYPDQECTCEENKNDIN